MPVTRYGVSPWLDRVPAKKRPVHPPFKGNEHAPLVIIGGGLAGVMTAYACAAAGSKVMLLEADRLGSGGSGRSNGVCAWGDPPCTPTVSSPSTNPTTVRFIQSTRKKTAARRPPGVP